MTVGARDVWQGESRTKLFLGICFVTGWLPKDPKVSTLDKQILCSCYVLIILVIV